MMDLPRLWTFGTLWCLSRLIVNDASLVILFFFRLMLTRAIHIHTHTQYRSCPPHGLPISQAPSWAITNTLPKSYGLRIGKAVHAGLSFPDIGVSSGLGLFFYLLSICANGAGGGGVGYWDIGLSYDGRDRRR